MDDLTGHCPIGVHRVKLKSLLEASSRTCLEEIEVESSQNFLFDYKSSFARSRLKYLGSNNFRHPSKLAGMEIIHVKEFVMGSKRLRTTNPF